MPRATGLHGVICWGGGGNECQRGRQVAAPTGAELFRGDPLRSVLCAVSLCGCYHGSLHKYIMVN